MGNQPHEEQILSLHLSFIVWSNGINDFKLQNLAINSAFAETCYIFRVFSFGKLLSMCCSFFIYHVFLFEPGKCLFITTVPSKALAECLPDTPA